MTAGVLVLAVLAVLGVVDLGVLAGVLVALAVLGGLAWWRTPRS